MSSRYWPVFTSMAPTLRRAPIRRSSSQERNGSLLFWTKTGPAVMFLNASCAFFLHSLVCAATTTVPLPIHRRSLVSATYLPAGILSVVILLVDRFHTAGS